MKCSNCLKDFLHKDKRTKNCSRDCFLISHSKRFKGVPQGFINDASIHWKGDDVGYSAIHIWLKKNYGRAICCEKCKTVTAKKYEWALRLGKKYERKRENFNMLCCKCHHKQDDIANRGWLTKKYALK